MNAMHIKLCLLGAGQGTTQKSQRIILYSPTDNESGDPYHLCHKSLLFEKVQTLNITFELLYSSLFSPQDFTSNQCNHKYSIFQKLISKQRKIHHQLLTCTERPLSYQTVGCS